MMIETCGDGKKMGELECDDGNRMDGDGCDSTCHVEPGYNCSGGNETMPDVCRNVQNFSYSVEQLDSFEQLLLSFNKEVKQLKTESGSLAIISSHILSLIKVTMWSETESSRDVTVVDGVAASTSSIRLKLANVGNTCGTKTINISLAGANFTDVWDNYLNQSDFEGEFLKRCFASIAFFGREFETMNRQKSKTKTESMTAQANIMLIIVVCLLATALLTVLTSRKGLSLFWELIGTSQILSLFCLINLKLLPASLIDFMKALGPALFSVLPNIFTLLTPDSISHANDVDNKPTDNLGYHPNIISKDFLLNIGNLVTLYLLVAVSYPVLFFASYKFPYFFRYMDKYKWNVVLRTAIMTFFQVCLAAFVQLKYVRFCLFCFF